MAKEDGGRKLDSGSVDGTVQAQRKVESDKNRETDPQIRAMEKFCELFNPACSKGHRCPMIPYGREICIQFHSKEECARN